MSAVRRIELPTRVLHRQSVLFALFAALAACAPAPSPVLAPHVDSALVRWDPPATRPDLIAWSSAVGPAAVNPSPSARLSGTLPALHDIVVISWNVHESNGRIDALLDDVSAGRITGTTPTQMILLLQEVYRSGVDVPPLPHGAKTPHIITSHSPQRDIVEIARRHGLAYVYVPSMRNGRYPREDRGNAILSTLPIEDVTAYELSHTRQRRVVVGATVRVSIEGAERRLRVFSLQLDTHGIIDLLGHTMHAKEIGALLPDLGCGRADPSDCLLGGDFNSFFGGREPAVRQTRQWFGTADDTDRRRTHIMGRLDHLFCHVPRGDWRPHTRRLNDRYGSDHYPLVTTLEDVGIRP